MNFQNDWEGMRLDLLGDFPCSLCGYDLRGIDIDIACPECGKPVRLSVFWALADQNHPQHDRVLSTLGLQDSMVPGYNGGAVSAVLKTLHYAYPHAYRRSVLERSKDAFLNLRAREIVDGFRDFVQDHFGSEMQARSLLQHWQLTTSEDLGRLIFALVSLGVLSKSSTDQIEQFDGLFDLDSLFRA